MDFYVVLGIAGLFGVMLTSSMLVEKGWDEKEALLGGFVLWWIASPYALWFWMSGQADKERAAKKAAVKTDEPPRS